MEKKQINIQQISNYIEMEGIRLTLAHQSNVRQSSERDTRWSKEIHGYATIRIIL